MDKIIIVGYGGHGKSVADSIRTISQFEIVGYTDAMDKHEKNIVYLGTDEALPQLYQSGIQNAALGVGYMGRSMLRYKLYKKLRGIGYSLPIIIDPSAIVSLGTEIYEGTFVGKRAVINAGASIGRMCIINTGSIIEHGNMIGDFTHIAVGAVLCGDVVIGRHCLIGANATVLQGLQIGDNAIIGAGSLVLRNVESNAVQFGKRSNNE